MGDVVERQNLDFERWVERPACTGFRRDKVNCTDCAVRQLKPSGRILWNADNDVQQIIHEPSMCHDSDTIIYAAVAEQQSTCVVATFEQRLK